MRKVFLLVFCLLSITGCSGKNGTTSTAANPGNAVMLSPIAIESPNVVATDDGVFYTDNQVLFFYDIVSGVNTPVCNRAECLHNDVTCTAYMPDISTSLFTDKSGHIFFTEFDNLYRINYDGTEKVKLYKSDNGAFWTKKFINYNGCLYFVEGIVDKNARVTYSLIELNISSGEEKTVYSSSEAFEFISAYGDNIIMTMGGGLLDADREISKFNLKTLENTTVSNGEHWAFALSDNIFYFSDDGKTMYMKNIDEGEEKVCAELKLKNTPVSAFPKFAFDNYILMHCAKQGEYIVNVNTGESMPFDLHLTAKYMKSVPADYVDPVLISALDRIGDYLVVYIGDKETEYMDTDPAGNMTEMYVMSGVIALISVEDFISNNPNYIVLNPGE